MTDTYVLDGARGGCPADMRNAEVFARISPPVFRRGLGLTLGHRGRGGIYIADPCTMRRLDEEGVAVPQPETFVLSPEACRELIEGLWREGYRPRGAALQDTLVGAKDAHIEDLRRLLYKQLKVDLP